jgi:hypothetical protein
MFAEAERAASHCSFCPRLLAARRVLELPSTFDRNSSKRLSTLLLALSCIPPKSSDTGIPKAASQASAVSKGGIRRRFS